MRLEGHNGQAEPHPLHPRLSPTAALYLRQQSSGGSGALSAGAIAGIAVGATVAALASATVCWVAARRWRRAARPTDSSAEKELECGVWQAEADGSPDCSLDAPSPTAGSAAMPGIATAAGAAAAGAAATGAALAFAAAPQRQASAGSSSFDLIHPTLPRGGSGPGVSPFEACDYDPFAASSHSTSRQAS